MTPDAGSLPLPCNGPQHCLHPIHVAFDAEEIAGADSARLSHPAPKVFIPGEPPECRCQPVKVALTAQQACLAIDDHFGHATA